MSYSVKELTLPLQPTAAIHATVPLGQLAPWLQKAYGEIITVLAAQHVSATGPPYGRFAFRGDAVDVEAGFPVQHTFIRDRRVVMSALPAGMAAVTTHFGPYEQLSDAYKDVQAWLDVHGFQQAGPHWEVYYSDPASEPDPATWRTDVFVPFVPSALAATGPSALGRQRSGTPA
ncbi:GyrI-like domain-containing protein [Catelliglobosispora koreensis]|uniref:GyrI-like domain-containing protein n=1 Tax=Catelliglobosispora koreensis TaxID=129052 RepID=UPI00035FD1EB|nr:GyrI-like domain-containing protein [Catelliglobosispora koreensis]